MKELFAHRFGCRETPAKTSSHYRRGAGSLPTSCDNHGRQVGLRSVFHFAQVHAKRRFLLAGHSGNIHQLITQALQGMGQGLFHTGIWLAGPYFVVTQDAADHTRVSQIDPGSLWLRAQH